MDMILEWLSQTLWLVPNYFWGLCILLLVVIVLLAVFIPVCTVRGKKLKTMKCVLIEEQKDNATCQCGCAEPESHECHCDDKKEQELRDEIENLRAQLLQSENEITSYDKTNKILTQALDEAKVNLAKKDEELSVVKEDNKTLMKTLTLFTTSKTVEPKKVEKKVKAEEAPKLTLKTTKKPEVKSVVVLKKDDLELLKRPDLMHLAKAEGVERFARKSNTEIIRLIRENRKKSKK